MKLPKRLDAAVEKLYLAFHSDQLNPECCYQCAVGNILDNKDFWKNFTNQHGSDRLNYVGIVHQNLGKTFNGYSPLELLTIESIFLEACGYSIPFGAFGNFPKEELNNDILFNGLCATIEYLCKLDGVENVMDYIELFKQESIKTLQPA